MHISIKIKKAIVCSFVAVFALSIFSTSIIAEHMEPPTGIKEQLVGISEEEKKSLQELFTLSQEIEVLEQEEKSLAKDIEATNKEIKELEASIASEEAAYAKKSDILKQLLNSYQRMGPGSYLEIIMDSDSLTSLLRRINTLRDITRNTGVLLEELDQSRRTMSIEKNRLDEKLKLTEQKQKQSKEALAKKLELKVDMEKSLLALKGKRQYFEKQLANMQKLLDDLKPMLAQAMKEFSNIIAGGSMPKDALKVSVSLFNVRASIDQKAFNEMIAAQPSLSEMKFTFHPGKTEISLPERNLIFTGIFVVVDGYTLRFQVEEGSFYGMPLEKEFIEQLLSEGEMSLDFKPLLGRNTIQSITTYEGYIELSIKPSFF